ncbi:hypothetical protein ACOME3_009462 [Neoechinorhynchus agilis]
MRITEGQLSITTTVDMSKEFEFSEARRSPFSPLRSMIRHRIYSIRLTNTLSNHIHVCMVDSLCRLWCLCTDLKNEEVYKNWTQIDGLTSHDQALVCDNGDIYCFLGKKSMYAYGKSILPNHPGNVDPIRTVCEKVHTSPVILSSTGDSVYVQYSEDTTICFSNGARTSSRMHWPGQVLELGCNRVFVFALLQDQSIAVKMHPFLTKEPLESLLYHIDCSSSQINSPPDQWLHLSVDPHSYNEFMLTSPKMIWYMECKCDNTQPEEIGIIDLKFYEASYYLKENKYKIAFELFRNETKIPILNVLLAVDDELVQYSTVRITPDFCRPIERSDFYAPVIEWDLNCHTDSNAANCKNCSEMLNELIKYLTLKRQELLFQRKDAELLPIIDTALLRSFLLVNNRLIRNMVRMANNQCHIDESVRLLMLNKRVDDAVFLYETRNCNAKAARLLLSQLSKCSGSVDKSAVNALIRNISQLQFEDFDLIVEGSINIKDYSIGSCYIYLNDETHILQIFRFIVETTKPAIGLEYLKYLIKNEINLCEKVKIEMASSLVSQMVDDKNLDSDLFSTLMHAMCSTESIKPNYELIPEIIERFSNIRISDGSPFLDQKQLFELINDCLSNTGSSNELVSDSIEAIDKIKTRPDRANAAYIAKRLLQSPEQSENFKAGLKLINDPEFSEKSRLQAYSILEQFSDDLPFTRINRFIYRSIVSNMNNLSKLNRIKTVDEYQLTKKKNQLVALEEQSFIVSSARSCIVCIRKIGTSAFVRLPNSSLVHLGCMHNQRRKNK